MNRLILIGMPGSGKTTLGRETARQLGWSFVDLDERVETAAGMRIPTIFAQEGEAGFRDRETAACRETAALERVVIACGGGVVLRPENREILAENGVIVWIDRPLSILLSDVDTADRPLLKDGRDRLTALWEQRESLYRQTADVRLPNDGDPASAVAALCRLSTLPPLRLAVIGDPIDHSLSPAVHLPTLRRFAAETTYDKIRVRREDLAAFAETARQTLDGFNLTMPHKAEILPFLDEISPTAAAIGAVNTVKVTNGRLFGDSTDGGFYDALTEAGITVSGKRVVLLGAGGAADTLAVCGAARGIAHLSVAARNAAKADALLQKARRANADLPTARFGFDELSAAVSSADILINATPLGMKGMADDFADLSFLSHLPPHAVVCDLIYRPVKTRFLAEAEKRGHIVCNGEDMLLYQAILADEIYLNLPLNRSRIAARVKAAGAFDGKEA